MNPLFSVVIGAALALIGGMVSQSIFLIAARRHEHAVLVAALKAELKVLRADLDASVEGFRLSLRKGESPTAFVFEVRTPIFDANAGTLGKLRDLDLIDQVVETYATLKEMTALALAIRTRKPLELRDLNEMHMQAAFGQLFVMKLHNRLLGHIVPINQTASEAETRRFVEKLPRPMTAEVIGRVQATKWH